MALGEALSADAVQQIVLVQKDKMPLVSLEGHTLGKYRVLEPLGGGGMARVYRAYHPQLDRYVAIKSLRPDLAEDEEFLARFQREARAVATLRHPNIVQVYDCDVQDDVYYMVMELLEGDTLKACLTDYRKRDERIPLGEVVRITLDVLNGLAYAHSEGMIHRDIKSANILLTRRGEAVLADFGIAQIVGATRHTASGALMGTLNYMAPEQGLKGEADVRSDIYSMGIVLYEMFTQRTPFEADTPLAILMKHLNDPLPLPGQGDLAIPEPFERVLLKALAKEPEDRYQTAVDMAHALRKAAETAGIELPQTVSLPLSPAEEVVPPESLAIFSGTARERIQDAVFAEGATDPPIGPAISTEGVEDAQALREAGKRFLTAFGGVAQAAMDKATDALHEAAVKVQPEKPSGSGADQASVDDSGEWVQAQEAVSPTRAPERSRRRGRVGAAIGGALWIMILGNLCMLTATLPTDNWLVYEQGWPIEIFLAAWALCLIMFVSSSLWTLIPTGLVLGTGVLLTVSWWTGDWEAWEHLWLFEVWIAVGVIGIPIALSRYRRLSRVTSRVLALLLTLASLGMILVVSLRIGLVGQILEALPLILP